MSGCPHCMLADAGRGAAAWDRASAAGISHSSAPYLQSRRIQAQAGYGTVFGTVPYVPIRSYSKMDIAWVRKMHSREPEVRIDIDAMNLIANIQAQTYYSNAIEAHLLNKPHPGLRTEPTPAV